MSWIISRRKAVRCSVWLLTAVLMQALADDLHRDVTGGESLGYNIELPVKMYFIPHVQDWGVI